MSGGLKTPNPSEMKDSGPPDPEPFSPPPQEKRPPPHSRLLPLLPRLSDGGKRPPSDADSSFDHPRSCGLRTRHSQSSFGGILAWVALSHEANRLV
ncbi:UNVERIFIED_CONTAM: hypothetical protein Slati_3718300 [Sesamum latifolium]|uniref:Uncharacterized protein n=1 Tax=Sesamum latifolium TaxID=2727402 RepID=A0AAW2U6A6_9LAMI